MTLPPRSRGWTRCISGGSADTLASPALAGMDPSYSVHTRICSRFPRARGDGPSCVGEEGSAESLPPRSRGWTLGLHEKSRRVVASPALAGMDPTSAWCTCTPSCFPRARGDGPQLRTSATVSSWLPPRSRGWTYSSLGHSTIVGASPALAGMDPLPDAPGNSRSRFPRARGDGPRTGVTQMATMALPPRSRGWTRPQKLPRQRLAASPALAGMDPVRWSACPQLRRFPRARGDGPVVYGRFASQVLLPPRSRGWTRRRGQAGHRRVASPALAGMDPRLKKGLVPWNSFPRARGDGPLSAPCWPMAPMLPPRSRGWTC